MLIYAGIDEAGYGPMLGPLGVGCSVFAIDDHEPCQGKVDLWKQLARVVCRKKSDRKHRIAIDDSKHLKGASKGKTHPLKHLERGVLAFLAASKNDPRDLPDTDVDLFELFDVRLPEAPWYDSVTELPVANDLDQLRIATSRLCRTMREQQVQCSWMGVEVVDAGPFNRQVDLMGNKASVTFGAVMTHVDRIWGRWPAEHPRVIVDRQGGRTHYREPLQMAFPEAHIRIVAEEEAISRYRLDREGSRLTISFLKEAEINHLPVALASMIAKYIRELAMIRMNRHFQAQMPELRPTAGYVQDARRYLVEIEPIIRSCEIDRRDLVRNC